MNNPTRSTSVYSAGRFAPSPSGPLHFGSLIAALGSFLIARTSGARWLIRIEDIDPPREIAGAASHILQQLEDFGLYWDGNVEYQSNQLDNFEAIIEQLASDGWVYACHCTRKSIHSYQQEHPEFSGLYPNLCANKGLSFDGEVALKLRHDARSSSTSFHDQIQGVQHFSAQLLNEDFTIKRKDGLIAYQLAVVVDDIRQGIDHVVRGCDLLDSTPRQQHLYRLLGAQEPDFYHLPLAVTDNGSKLSKQNHATAIAAQQAPALLVSALQFLGQKPPRELNDESVTRIISWALEHFSVATIPKQQQILFFD